MTRAPLSQLAFARSGDKGDVVNIGLMAKSPRIYGHLVETLTPELVKAHFKDMVKGRVELYPMPNLDSIALVLRQALGGGATSTLRFDWTGKAMGAALLRLEIDVDASLLEEARRVTEAIEKRPGAEQ